jgi:tRNA1Val (adenine37-N6)-methyltransferase
MSPEAPDDRDALTCDAALRGQLRLWQPARGYRFAVDSLLLADFAAAGPTTGPLVDLGAGCGVVGLALARRCPEITVTLVELQPRLAELAARNVAENGLADRVAVLQADLAHLRGRLPGAQTRSVVSNPPFQPQGVGSEAPDPERRIALSETACTLEGVVRAARRLLAPGGSVHLVYPSERAGEVLATLARAGLPPTRLRPVYPLPGLAARRVLVAGKKARTARLVVEPPLTIHAAPGQYTDEVARILGEPG